jgi:DNA mismatch endonuclease (patch repair protein)
MSRIKRRDTSLELKVRAKVRALGEAYRVDVGNLPGRPDLSNKSRRWAIFVNGCFWHQHEKCNAARIPGSNVSYWTAKLARNKARDQRNVRQLRALGFLVLTVWECEMGDITLERALTRFFARVRARKETTLSN